MNLNTAAIQARTAELNANDFVVYATSMIYAQGVTLTAEQRAHLKARGDFMREITGTNAEQRVFVSVRDPRNPDVCIGELWFRV